MSINEYQDSLDEKFKHSALPENRIDLLTELRDTLKSENTAFDQRVDAYGLAYEAYQQSGARCPTERDALTLTNEGINADIPRYRANFHMIKRCDELLARLQVNAPPPAPAEQKRLTPA